MSLLFSSFSLTASAQTEEELVARRIALTRAETAANEGRHQEATELAERAGRIQMTPSIRLFLAREYQQQDRFSTAMGHADACVREVTRDANVPNRETVLAACRTLLRELQSRVATITLNSEGAPLEGLVVRVNGTLLSRAMIGLPHAVDPGHVIVEATAPGHRPYRWEGSVPTGTDRALTLALEVENNSIAPRAPRPTAQRSLAPFALVGVGGAALVASGVFYGLRIAAMDGCVVNNDVGYCNSMQRLERARNEAPLFNGLAIGSLVGGTLLAGAGVLWYVLAPAPRTEQSTAMRWWFAPSTTGLSMGANL